MAQIVECVPNFSEGRNKNLIQAITQEMVVYVGGLRRYRATVNNDGGAVLIWKLAQEDPPATAPERRKPEGV